MEPSCYSAGGGGIRGVSNRNGRGRRTTARRVGATGRVASPGTEKSVSGQTVLRVVRRIVSDPDSRELSQTAFSSETTQGSPPRPSIFSFPLWEARQCGPDGWNEIRLILLVTGITHRGRIYDGRGQINRGLYDLTSTLRSFQRPSGSLLLRRLLGIYRHLTHLTLSGTVYPVCEIFASFMRDPRTIVDDRDLLRILGGGVFYLHGTLLFEMKWTPTDLLIKELLDCVYITKLTDFGLDRFLLLFKLRRLNRIPCERILQNKKKLGRLIISGSW